MKIKYTVYEPETFEIIKYGLTRNAAKKLAEKKGKEYGSAPWVEDRRNEVKEKAQ